MSLTFRRLIAFVIDLAFILSLIIFVDLLFALYLLFLSSDNQAFITIHMQSRFLLITFLLGFFNSSLFDGQSLGSKMSGIIVTSHKKKLLSVIGCVARSILILWIPFLYFTLLFVPYVRESMAGRRLSEFSLPGPELFIFSFFIWIVPLSIIWSNGNQSVYDLLLKIRVLRNRDSKTRLQELTMPRLIGALCSTVILSILPVILIQEATFLRGIMSKIYPMFVQFDKPDLLVSKTTYEAYKRMTAEQNKSVHEIAMILLNDSDIKSVSDQVSIGIQKLYTDKPFAKLTIPANTEVHYIELHLSGKGARKQKETLIEIRDAIERRNPPYKFLRIFAVREAIFGTCLLSTKIDCYFLHGEKDPLDCDRILGGGIVLSQGK